MKKLYYYFKISAVIIALVVFFTPVSLAQINTGFVDIEAQTDEFREGSGYEMANDRSVGTIVGGIIKTFISLLGIIFVILIIYAGYNWMTANGDEGKIKKAKNIIQTAIIGLVIIVAAYSITYFVFKSLDTVTTEVN